MLLRFWQFFCKICRVLVCFRKYLSNKVSVRFRNFKSIRAYSFFELEYPVRSGNLIWKYWWKNERKMPFYSGDMSPRNFREIVDPRYRNHQFILYVIFENYIFSEVVCCPNFSYNMNHGTSTRMVLGKPWRRLNGLEDSSM